MALLLQQGGLDIVLMGDRVRVGAGGLVAGGGDSGRNWCIAHREIPPPMLSSTHIEKFV